MPAVDRDTAEGIGRATRRLRGVGDPVMTEVFNEFNRCPPKGQVAFARTWVKKIAESLEETWPLLYEMLKVIEESEIYKKAFEVGNSKNAVSYETFANYFESVVKRPFAEWSELENTYHYVTRYAPELFTKPYAEAESIRLRAQAHAEEAEPLAEHGEIGRGRDRGDHITSKGRGTAAEYLTRRIARDRPDILAAMKRGEYPSVRAAAKAAGIIKEKTGPLTDEEWRELQEALSGAGITRVRQLMQKLADYHHSPCVFSE
jgi:hypothetical protein